MNIKGYEIDVENCRFKQEQQVILRFEKTGENDELFPVTYYMDNRTGEHSLIENDIAQKPNRGIGLHYYYAKDQRVDIQYDEKANCLVFMLLELELRRNEVKLGEPVLYKETQRFYVTPQKNIIRKSKANNDEWKFVERMTKLSDLPFNPCDYDFLNEATTYSSKRKLILDTAGKVFNKVVVTAGNNTICLNSIENIIEFLMYKETKPKSGPLQRKVNEYCSIPLPEYIPIEKEQSSIYVTEGRLVRIKDDVLCIQIFTVLEDRKTYYEAYRMFVSTDGTITTCKKNNFNEFVATTSALKGSHWVFNIDEYNEKSVENTKLSYYKDIIKDIPSCHRGYAVWCFIYEPVFERLYKMGLSNTINTIFTYCCDNPIILLKDHFGAPNIEKKDKNIFAMLGLNKHQLDRYIEKTKDSKFLSTGFRSNSLIYHIKNILTGSEKSDISSIDNETFDVIFDMLTRYNKVDTYMANAMHDIVKVYGVKTLLSNLDTLKFIYSNQDQNSGFYMSDRYFKDYIDMVGKMDMTSSCKPKFTSTDALKTAHDNIMCLYNLKKDEFKVKNFQKAMTRVEQYAYKDDNYEIVIPSVPDDMVREGNELHHCVKSYIDRVINGTTNIVFLRKASEIDVPFFTIEVSNEGTVEQIHGLCNRNASSEPDMLYFINDWMKKFKLKNAGYNKVR